MPTITGIHLQYRLWIANLNADIDVMRILNDYLTNTATKESSADTLSQVNIFKKKFLDIRTELDALRHEMHLNKMKLASLKDQTQSIKEIENSISHKTLKERYSLFRKTFTKTKNEFQKFQNTKAHIVGNS